MTGFSQPFPVPLAFANELFSHETKPEIAPRVVPPLGRRYGRSRLPFRPLSKRASLDHRDCLRAQCQGPEPCSTALLSGASRLLRGRQGPIPCLGPETRRALTAPGVPEDTSIVERALRDPQGLLAVSRVGDFSGSRLEIHAGLASYPRLVNSLRSLPVKRRRRSGRPATLSLCRVRPATGATVSTFRCHLCQSFHFVQGSSPLATLDRGGTKARYRAHDFRRRPAKLFRRPATLRALATMQ